MAPLMEDQPYYLPDNWGCPHRCPFCNAAIESPGIGFMAHLEDSESCKRGFRIWRDHVSDDMSGGWGG